VAHAAETLRAVFAEVLLSANTDAYDFLGVQRVEDRYRDAGPLAGIDAALATTGRSHIFVLPCDTPLVSPPTVRTMCELAAAGRITAAEGEDGLQPLVGIYPRQAAAGLGMFLEKGGRRVMDFLDREGYERFDLRSRGLRLRNVNTPHDFARL
jgi:molybdopterin-guanine dinucleotide biosynthesis protein A